MIARGFCRWFGGAVAICALAGLAHAQGASEAAVKAAFLYKFAGYVEWGPGAFARPDSPVVYGILGADDVAIELEVLLRDRAIHGRPVLVKRLKPGEALRGVKVLFVGRGEPGLPAILRATHSEGVLAVTETGRGLELGAVINFVVVGAHVAFEVSLESAERSGLRISSRMLAVARRVVSKS